MTEDYQCLCCRLCQSAVSCCLLETSSISAFSSLTITSCGHCSSGSVSNATERTS
ncbi:hypothetical protein BJV78DRAFT_1192732 [Lactifluus subvellereus]|nr:hypothetical protein BJV78DRAFT_1192732 [Lactifluus subvellereus]